MGLHYVEHVASEPDATVAVLSAAGWRFSEPQPELGGARIAERDGVIVAVRGPMSPDEAPVTRAYTRVANIDQAWTAILAAGAAEMLGPTPIEGRGRIAIAGVGGQQVGLWEP